MLSEQRVNSFYFLIQKLQRNRFAGRKPNHRVNLFSETDVFLLTLRKDHSTAGIKGAKKIDLPSKNTLRQAQGSETTLVIKEMPSPELVEGCLLI